MTLTCSTSQPVAHRRQVGAHPLHLVVVGAADQVDELGVRAAQHGAPVDQPALVEGAAERQRARLRDDRLVEVEERRRPGGRGCGGRGRSVSATASSIGTAKSGAPGGRASFARQGASGTSWSWVLFRQSTPRPAHPPRVGPQTAPALPPGGGRRMSRQVARPVRTPVRRRPVVPSRSVAAAVPRSRRALPAGTAARHREVTRPRRWPCPPVRCSSPATRCCSTTCSGWPPRPASRPRWPRTPSRPAAPGPPRRWCWSAPTPSASSLRVGLPRRPGVVVVPTDLDDAQLWQLAAAAGAESVQPLPGAEALLVDRLAAAADGPARGTTVAVVGGRGGAGASTLACALARTARAAGDRAARRRRPARRRAGPADGCRRRARACAGPTSPRPAAGRARTSCAPPCRASTASRCCPGTAATRSSCRPPRWTWSSAPAAAVTTSSSSTCRAAGTPQRARRSRRPTRCCSSYRPRSVRWPPRGRWWRGWSAGSPTCGSWCAARRRPGCPTGWWPRELGLPLAGWLAPEPGLAAAQERGEPPGRSGRGPLVRLCTELLADLARPGGPGGMTRRPRSCVARVTERLALAGEAPTAAAVTTAVRHEGAVLGGPGVAGAGGRGPLRADRLRPARAAAGRPGGQRRPGQRPGRGVGRPRRRADPGGRPVPRRGGGTPAGPAARGLGRPAPRRRAADRRRPAGRGSAAARRAAAGVSRRDAAQPAGRAAAHVHPRRAGGPADGARPGSTEVLGDLVRARVSFLVTGGTGTGKTTLLATLLSLVPAAGADGPGRGLRRAGPDPSARRAARGAHRERRGRRGGRPARPGPRGAADAAGPARRRRGPRRRGRRAAGGAEHRSRRRRRHGARLLRGRPAGPARGARAGRRAAARGAAQPARRRRPGRAAPGPYAGRRPRAARGRLRGPRPRRAEPGGAGAAGRRRRAGWSRGRRPAC